MWSPLSSHQESVLSRDQPWKSQGYNSDVSASPKKEGNLHHKAEGKGSAGEEKERGAKTGVRRRFYLLHASAMQVRRTLRAQKGSTKTEEWGKGSVKELGLIFPLLF